MASELHTREEDIFIFEPGCVDRCAAQCMWVPADTGYNVGPALYWAKVVGRGVLYDCGFFLAVFLFFECDGDTVGLSESGWVGRVQDQGEVSVGRGVKELDVVEAEEFRLCFLPLPCGTVFA